MLKNKNLIKKIGAALITTVLILPVSQITASARGNNYAIDIYNGDEISTEAYDRIARDGTSVIIKATEGVTGTDSYVNYRGNVCQQKGIDFSFYHMLTTRNPEEQAEHFFEVTKNFNNTMLNALDVEYPGVANVAEEYANRFMQRYYELSGQTMMVYSCESYLHENFSSSFLNSHYLWCANYSRKPNVPNLVVHQFKEGTDPTHNYGGNWKGEIDQNEIYMPEVLYRNGRTNYQAPAYNNAVVSQQSEIIQDCTEGENIRSLQHLCNIYGAGIAEDGILGPQTRRAVKNNLPVLRKGSRGTAVKWVQEQLGFTDEDLDGIYGNLTAGCVSDWQSRNADCYGVDGVVGVNTYLSLATR